ncbi:MAG: hypothetical protein M1820_003733 [Bogoriella megaspora]|nr:MAG: hypothetical protein M1820_003733 [Bogoriella megaspora]
MTPNSQQPVLMQQKDSHSRQSSTNAPGPSQAGKKQPLESQQAAWLYERHFAQVRAQMKRVGASNAPSPVPSSGSMPTAGGIAMKRLGSGGSRAPSALSTRSKDSAMQKGDGSVPSTPRGGAPTLSRTTSKDTVTQSRQFPPQSPRQQLTRSFRGGRPSPKPEPSLETTGEEGRSQELSTTSPSAQSSEESSSESTSESEGLGGRSRVFKRMPRFSNKSGGHRGGDAVRGGEEEDEEPAFLPFAQTSNAAAQDPSATLRNPRNVDDAKARSQKPTTFRTQSQPQQHHQRTESSTSSASSNAAAVAPTHRVPGALSPRHRAELSKLSSPHLKRAGSDGAPSMGSSFSDLDGALNSSTTSLRSGYDRVLPNR